MSYIVPNSTVKLISNCPLDKSQRDTWYFNNIQSQYNYFNSIVTQTFTAQSYQRVNKNTIRLEYKADSLYSVNYMMFINTNYNPVKWFYAFVDRIEYINDNTCNVHYTIDVIQTWFFEYQERQCFIQRMSVASDGIGENIEPEPLTIPEYVNNGVHVLDNLKPIVVTITQLDDADKPYLYFENTICAGKIILTTCNITEAINFLEHRVKQAMLENPDYVIDMHTALIPNGDVRTVAPDAGNPAYYEFTERKLNAGGFSTQFTIDDDVNVSSSSTLDGYKPHNKKLYTYPFNYLNIFNANGDSLTLRYEFFRQNQYNYKYLKLAGNVLAPASVRIYPVDYKNSDGDYYGENISITGFPSCSWSTDAFRSWVAQNSVPIAINLTTSLVAGSVAMGFNMLSGGSQLVGETVASGISKAGVNYESVQKRYSYSQYNPESDVKNVVNGVNSLTDIFIQGYQASLANQITKGSYQNGSFTFMKNFYHFYGTRSSIPATTARRFDAYFDAFGYAYNNIATPSRRNRKRYTYIQTRNCLVDGNLPAIDREQIEGIYNEGIRFWVNGVANIGEYNIADNGTL